MSKKNEHRVWWRRFSVTGFKNRLLKYNMNMTMGL